MAEGGELAVLNTIPITILNGEKKSTVSKNSWTSPHKGIRYLVANFLKLTERLI